MEPLSQSDGNSPANLIRDQAFQPFLNGGLETAAPWIPKLVEATCGAGASPTAVVLVLCAAEPKNRQENDSQKSEADSEACAFAEAFPQIDAENNSDDEINERDEHQKDPPPWPADNLAPNIKIIDWDDAGPTGLAGFGEHFPHRHDYQQRNE